MKRKWNGGRREFKIPAVVYLGGIPVDNCCRCQMERSMSFLTSSITGSVEKSYVANSGAHLRSPTEAPWEPPQKGEVLKCTGVPHCCAR